MLPLLASVILGYEIASHLGIAGLVAYFFFSVIASSVRRNEPTAELLAGAVAFIMYYLLRHSD